MSSSPVTPPLRRRGQTLLLGVVTLLVLALIVFVTINLTVAVQQKVALQNYADAKAFSVAVAEARALNYFAYTNRAIASGYVGMANVHAYMSEAAMLADLKNAAGLIMMQVAAQETAQCLCCLGLPCCAIHCAHALEATTNATMLFIDWAAKREMGRKLQRLDGPAARTLDALHAHIQTLHLSQQAVRANVDVMLLSGEVGSALREGNMAGAARVTRDVTALGPLNVAQWERLFYSDVEKKKRIMAETVNATRQDFAWNRAGTPLAQPLLFPPPWLARTVRATTLWLGPGGNWTITQIPPTGLTAPGRTGVTDGDFPMQAGFFVALAQDTRPSSVRGRTMASYDTGLLAGNWRHGAGAAPLPLGGPAIGAQFSSGSSWKHSGGVVNVLNNPHTGGAHNRALDMNRFMEFNISERFPYNQPVVYAGATTDSRVNEFGLRGTGAYEVARDGSGTVSVSGMGPQEGRLTLSNNREARAFSKAMVYYHRIGDWSDYPNLFNPYWRAKLHPLTAAESLAVSLVDPAAAAVVGGASIVPSGGAAVNVQ